MGAGPPGVWEDKVIHTQVAAFPLWVSVPRCLVGKALVGVPPGPSECGVLRQGCPGATFLLNAGAREVRQIATL